MVFVFSVTMEREYGKVYIYINRFDEKNGKEN